MHSCIVCVPGAHRSKKEMSDPLELELQTVVNRHVGVGTHTQVL